MCVVQPQEMAGRQRSQALPQPGPSSTPACCGITSRRSPPPQALCSMSKTTLCIRPRWVGPSSVCQLPLHACSTHLCPHPGSRRSLCSEAHPCSVVQAPPPTSPPLSLSHSLLTLRLWSLSSKRDGGLFRPGVSKGTCAKVTAIVGLSRAPRGQGWRGQNETR